MLERLANLSKTQSFFLFGARGTGKTSLLKSSFISPEVLYINLLLAREYQELLLNPDSLVDRIIFGETKRVIIDEIQKIPKLLDVVHNLIEEHKEIQFILTGSSARKLKRGGGNLLAGRAFVSNLFPFTSIELGLQFDLNSVLRWGSLPNIFALESIPDKENFLRAYVHTYLKEEILEEQVIRNLDPFQRFLPIAAQCSGQILNFHKISKEVGVASQTVQNYFQILEDTLVGFFLPAFHPSIRKQERQGKKFYIFDTGVMHALKRTLDIPISPQTYNYGLLFEHFIIQDFSRLCAYKNTDEKLYFYQTQGGLEIDLIIEKPGRPVLAIEIKSSESVTIDHLRHLRSFKDIMPNSKRICISKDPNRKEIEGILCLPYQEALDMFYDSSLYEM